jgi:tetratricopeptide (TPR) repeat protein
LRTFFLFYLLSYLLRNPLLALIIVAVVFYLAESRYSGRYFNPASFFDRQSTIRELRRTVDANDHNVAAHNDLGRLLADAGEFEEGLEHMEKAIARMEESPETNFYYGLCLLRTGRHDEGIARIRKALEINPRFGYGHPQLVIAERALESGDLDDALRWAREGVTLNTSSVQGWVVVGKIERRLGNREAAREAFQSAKLAFADLPHYLRLANRKWYAQAKKELRSA